MAKKVHLGWADVDLTGAAVGEALKIDSLLGPQQVPQLSFGEGGGGGGEGSFVSWVKLRWSRNVDPFDDSLTAPVTSTGAKGWDGPWYVQRLAHSEGYDDDFLVTEGEDGSCFIKAERPGLYAEHINAILDRSMMPAGISVGFGDSGNVNALPAAWFATVLQESGSVGFPQHVQHYGVGSVGNVTGDPIHYFKPWYGLWTSGDSIYISYVDMLVMKLSAGYVDG